MTPISTTRYWWWKSDINNVKQQKLLVQLLFFLSLMRKVKYPSFVLGIYILQALPIKVRAKSKEGVSSVQSCLTLCDPMNCSMLGLPVYHQLPEFTQTHVHWVGVLHSFWSFSSLISSSILGIYWPGSSSFSVLSFCLFILLMWFSRQEYWSGLPFSSSVNHMFSELSTMTRPSWVALHRMAHSSVELDKAVVHEIRLVSFLWLWFSFCLPSDG